MNDKQMVIKEKLNVVKGRGKRFCSKFKTGLIILFAFLFLLAVIVAWGAISHIQNNAKAETPVITEYFIEEQLNSIGELNTAEYTYTIERSYSDYRTVLNCNIPLTKKSIFMQYSGKVKVGYNIADMKYNKEGNKIKFNIPEPIVENYISDGVAKHEDESLFNRFYAEDYVKLSEGVLDEGLSKAVEKGIYETAENNLKSILTTHFEELGCSVEFD